MAKYLDAFNDLQKIQRPQFLYKYRPINKYTYDMLDNNYLWCTSVDNYNDPYEGHFNICFEIAFKHFIADYVKPYVDKEKFNYLMDLEVGNGELLGYIEKELHMFQPSMIKEAYKNHKNYLNKRKKEIKDKICLSYRICSLSETYDNILMWSHYADFHKGICIKYKSDSLKDYLYKVNYTSNVLHLSKLKRIDRKSSELFINHVMCTKNLAWSYEKEWRLLFEENKLQSNKYEAVPIEILLGTNISKYHERRVKKIAKNKGISVTTLKLDEKNYKIINT